jgi:ubiquinone/menaquinone biosynthesis C-methylase UbiE
MIKSWLRLPWSRTAAAFDRWSTTYEVDADRMIRGRGYSYKQMADLVVARLGIRDSAQILEVGTGPGNLGIQFVLSAPQADVIGVDISERMLTRAAAKNVYPFIARANAERLPFSTNRFDGLYSAFVLHSVFDQTRAFAEFRRVLKPGARAVVIDLFPLEDSANAPLIRGFFHSVRHERGAPALYRSAHDYVSRALDQELEIINLEPLGQPRGYMHYMLTLRKPSKQEDST